MNRSLRLGVYTVMIAATLAPMVSAAGGAESHGLDPMVLVGVAVILIFAKLGGEIFERLGQPAVLGELIAGIVIGNLTLVHFTAFEPLKSNEVIAALAELGVIILLFEVGLESDLKEMRSVGFSALLVAAAGVIAPFFLGWGVAAIFLPAAGRWTHIFIGATLCATSIGITARVLKDLGKLDTREARIILGAAVLDDVLGLLILAVVAGAISAAAAGGTLSFGSVALIAGKAVGFLVAAVLIGQFVVPLLFRGLGKMASNGALLALSLAFCLLLAWAAGLVGLAAIVGAFAAGVVLDEVHFEHLPDHNKHHLEELLAPVGAILAPIFFVVVGMKVDLRVFGSWQIVAFGAALIVAGVVGKQVCSLVVTEKSVNRLAVGVGMIPRGEVGLIFAGIGAALMLPNAAGQLEPVISPATFGAVVIMVMVTTLLTPPVLKRVMTRS